MDTTFSNLDDRLIILENFLYQQWYSQKNNSVAIEWDDFLSKNFQFGAVNTVTDINVLQIKQLFDRPIITHPQNIVPIFNTTNHEILINMDDYFAGSSGQLVYIISDNIFELPYTYWGSYSESFQQINNLSISYDSDIKILSDYRGVRYTISVTAIYAKNLIDVYPDNLKYYGQTLYLDLVEQPVPPIQIFYPIDYIYFSDQFALSCNLNTLTVFCDYRGYYSNQTSNNFAYEIQILAIDDMYPDNPTFIHFKIMEEPPPIPLILSEKIFDIGFKVQQALQKVLKFYDNISINISLSLDGSNAPNINISNYHDKLYPDILLDGKITSAYIIGTDQIPRDGIFNYSRYNELDFTYIATISNDILTKVNTLT
eukprot:764716-Hanusia_phi.AAC.2